MASANPVRYVGATPTLVDVEAETYNLDPAMVVAELDRRARLGLRQPRAIEVVHLVGHPADIEPIVDAAERHGVTVFEDASEALGARYVAGRLDGQHVGTIGRVGCFSFNGNKLITTGGGGMLVTDEEPLARRARHLSTQARLPGRAYDHDEVGFNYRLSNVAAALGVAQLEQLPELLAGAPDGRRALRHRVGRPARVPIGAAGVVGRPVVLAVHGGARSGPSSDRSRCRDRGARRPVHRGAADLDTAPPHSAVRRRAAPGRRGGRRDLRLGVQPAVVVEPGSRRPGAGRGHPRRSAPRGTPPDADPRRGQLMDEARPEPSPAPRRPSWDALLAVTVFVLATAVAIWASRPWIVGAVGSDAASTVLYFDRLAAGVRLERFLGTTPKPFLTLVYGSLHAAFGDWRAISWLVVVVYGLAVAAAAVLARRLSGSRAGGVFVAFGLIASTGLLLDVSLAYTVSWSLLLWSVAGLAATADRPRYELAGLALMVAALIRPETLFISALAGVLLVAGTIAARTGRGRPAQRAAWLVMLSLLAVPLSAVHDGLLTGDVLYSLQVPVLGTGIRDPQSAGTAARIVVNHVTALLPMVLLAGIGVVLLVQRRAWPILVGLAALGPGIAAVVLYLGARGVFVLDRYALPIDLTIIFLAGLGFSALAVPALSHLGADRTWARSATHLAVAAGLALALSPAVAPLDRTVITQIRADQDAITDFQAAAPSIAGNLDAIPGVRDRPDRSAPANPAVAEPVALLVPARLLPQAAVDLALPLTQVDRIGPGPAGAGRRLPGVRPARVPRWRSRRPGVGLRVPRDRRPGHRRPDQGRARPRRSRTPDLGPAHRPALSPRHVDLGWPTGPGRTIRYDTRPIPPARRDDLQEPTSE